jgi:hypothetical protein
MCFWELVAMARWWIVMGLAGFLLGGCASYKPAQGDKKTVEDMPGEEIVVTEQSIEVRFLPVFEKMAARKFFGIDPQESQMAPAMLRVKNLGDKVLKVDLEKGCVVTESGDEWRLLLVDEAIERARRSDAEVLGWYFAFGVVGMMASMDHVTTVNRTLEQDYHARYFQPAVINPGTSGGGVVFFDHPVLNEPQITSAVVRVTVLDTEQSMSVTIPLSESKAD